MLRFVLVLALGLATSVAASSSEGKAWLAENAVREGVTVTNSGLQYRVLASGAEGAPSPDVSSPCVCHYHGTLIDGTLFDSSVKRGSPATFAPNQVIKGWTEAMQLMKEGDKWELAIPSELGYGERGSGAKIPGGAVLIFELEMIKVKEPSALSIMGFDLAEPKNAMLLFGLLYLMYNTFAGTRGGGGGGGGGAAGKKRVSLGEATSEANPRVFFDMTVGGAAAGRVTIELFASVAPRTAENFRALCTGEKGECARARGKPLHFKGSTFHRVIPGFMCQGGDFTRGNGTGGESIYGETFDDEWDGGVIGHTEPMLLSMANCGPNTNGSQFFLTVAATPHLDGKHVVFGRVCAGADVVKAIEGVGSGGGTTRKPVVIADCGEVKGKAT